MEDNEANLKSSVKNRNDLKKKKLSILNWVSLIHGPNSPPESYLNHSFDNKNTNLPKNINQIDEVATQVEILLKNKGLRAKKEERTFKQLNHIELVYEDEDDTPSDKIRPRKFVSFDSFDSEINSLNTVYLNHLLDIYSNSRHLRDKQKKFFNFLDHFYTIYKKFQQKSEKYDEKLNFQNEIKKCLFKQKFLIFKYRVYKDLHKGLYRYKFFRKFLYRNFYSYKRPKPNHNFCMFYQKKFLNFLQSQLNNQSIDIGYQYLMPDQLKLIFNWLRNVQGPFDAPKSLTNLECILKQEAVTNKEEIYMRMFEVDSKPRNVTEGVKDILVSRTIYPIMTPLFVSNTQPSEEEISDSNSSSSESNDDESSESSVKKIA